MYSMKKLILFAVVACSMLCMCAQQNVKLPAPAKKGGKSIVESLWARQSGTEFSSKMLTEQDLSNLLFSAVGINREDGRLTSPTARNLQEIRVFVFTAEGVSEYMNKENSLRPVVKGDYRQLIAAHQDWVKSAPVSLLIVADEKKFGSNNERSKTMMALDAGIVCENINIFCAGTGLVTRPRASMDEAGIKSLLGFDDTITLLLNNPVGYPKDSKKK